MNIIGIGTDIVSIERFKNIPDLERFCEYILSKEEMLTMKKSRNPIEFLASRFSAKESLIKAYPEVINYHDIETGKNGEKFIQKVLKYNAKKYTIHSSISHSFENAIAVTTITQ